MTALPVGTLSPEIHFASESSAWKAIDERLKRAAPKEACVFVLARPSRGTVRSTLILREPIWPNPGDVQATPYSLDISADYITRALDAAIDSSDQTGIVLIHTHPNTDEYHGIGRFSPRDDWYETRLFPTITLGRPLALSGSIVLGPEPHDVDGRVWWNDGGGLRTQAAQILRVVGPELRMIELKASSWTDHPDPTVMDRSTRIWGAQGRRRLQNLRVGFVGAGGTGSIAIFCAATMGVGKLRAWDKDKIKKENLHRTLGATRDMIGHYKVEALAGIARAVATAEPFDFESIQNWATSAEGLKALKDCDLIFCCVDKFAPRVPLNDLAYAHCIPTIDMASWIHQTSGHVDAIMTHAHVWSPGLPCAWCRGTLTSHRLTQEAQGQQRDIERRIPYGLPLGETDGVEPSVLPLNLAGVSLALLQFMQVALQITDRTPRDLKLWLPAWELDESDLDSLPDCSTELDTAAGDDAKIRAV